MHSPLQLAVKFFKYKLTARNGKGHGIHSPLVFEFVTKVLNGKTDHPAFTAIENRRKELLADNTVIEVEDFGAGSSVIKTNKRVVKKIAASSLKPKKYATLLHNMVLHYRPQQIIELGTSFGITTSYIAVANPGAHIYTCEGSENIAAIALQTFSKLQLKNVELVKGDFSKTLGPILQKTGRVDFAYIDGNHRREPTLRYFQQLLNHAHDNTILVLDDIHWSREMEEAWEEIKAHPAVTLTIDLFFIGCVFISKNFKEKQHFTIRF